MAKPQDIIDFWYSEPMCKHWFSSTPAIDQDIRQRFETLWERGQAGELALWAETAEGILALIILFDQMPLNMFRNQAKSFQTEHLAIKLAHQAINQKKDQQIPHEQLAFLYMPLMHSENLADQDLSVRCYEQAGLTNNLRFAKHHQGLIRRFGRFPHRNEILGRTSTVEELAYLNSKEAFKG